MYNGNKSTYTVKISSHYATTMYDMIISAKQKALNGSFDQLGTSNSTYMDFEGIVQDLNVLEDYFLMMIANAQRNEGK